ncbi:hypothetical protein BC826DRAFT_39580 [Russula brevipes]|nr:hypothetical protein BC826DRAFT_39580 [Russula brevipes]
MHLLSYCGTHQRRAHRWRPATAHGPMRMAKVYIRARTGALPRHWHLCYPSPLSTHDPNSTMPFPTLFSHKTSQTSATTGAAPTRRRSTTISMMEEEFGMREPPQTATHFGLPSGLKILPPKPKRSPTQLPEPRRNSSFLKGSWEMVWGCDEDGVDLVETPPEEDVYAPPDSVLDHVGQDSELDQDVATPTNGSPWSTDGEITPLFSSNFPSIPDPSDLRHVGHPTSIGEPLRNDAPHPTDPDT